MSIGKIIGVKGSAVAEFTSTVILVALLGYASLFGQSAAQVTELQTFHIQGAIRYYNDSPVSGAEVTFEGGNISKTVSADKNGFYETELPVGIYTMSAQDLSKLHYKYVRPPFRVTSSTSVTLNVTFYAGFSCDLKIPTPEDVRNACEGIDLFPIPSKDNVPFQLSIQYSSRQPTDRGCEYSGLKISLRPIGRGDNDSSLKTPADLKIRLFVAYNLFTLQADHVVYDVQSRTLEATGDVVATNDDGATQRADSMTFKIENGEATPLPSLQTDKNTLSTNECFAKGGLGIVNTNLYIDLKSAKNELQLNAGNKWTGQSTSTQEVAIFFDNKIWSPQALPNGFDLSKSVVISFEGDKVRFFDFGKMSGGFYKRPKQN